MSLPASRASLTSFLDVLGLDLYGYAAMTDILPGAWGRWPYAISIALALPAERMAGVWAGPTPAYYDAYETVNARLNETSRLIELWLLDAGYRAQAFAATVSGEALEGLGPALSAPVQHKTVATRAGLGWIGKNGLLITRAYGPRVRLASVFTDFPLPTCVPFTEGACGSCTRCVDACPAGALLGATWYVGMPRAKIVDAHRCEEVATRLLEERVGAHNAVCGICIAVCPFAGLSRIGGNERAK